MPSYTESDLIRARRPLADPSERGDAACTLGHLETEQRESPTAERAGIIREVTARIASFDGVDVRIGASEPASVTTAAPASPPVATVLPPLAPVAAPLTGGLEAGISLSAASMERTLRRSGMTPVANTPAGLSVGATSMERTLRRMGLTPQARS